MKEIIFAGNKKMNGYWFACFRGASWLRMNKKMFNSQEKTCLVMSEANERVLKHELYLSADEKCEITELCPTWVNE